MTKVITTEELKKKIDEGGDFHLIDTLSSSSFEARHIPGAKNIPNSPTFVEDFEKEIGVQKDAEIITYCSSSECMASVHAANALEAAGYTQVMHYKDGLTDWRDAGYSFSPSSEEK
jgi:rhodanese-related sulfurtransferase